MTVSVIVYGRPAPQGSKSPKGRTKTGRMVMVESSKYAAPWREMVWAEAVRSRDGAPPLDGPLIVRMVFTLAKPVSASKRRHTRPDRIPDLSKLARSTEDALTNAGVWADDARVVEYSRLAKVYPGEDPEALEAPGVRITIDTLNQQFTLPSTRGTAKEPGAVCPPEATSPKDPSGSEASRRSPEPSVSVPLVVGSNSTKGHER